MTPTTDNLNPIIVIDDDEEDIEIFQKGFKELGIVNKILVFNDPQKFYNYISTTNNKSFFIFCDINMCGMNGFQLKKKVFDNEEIRLKCIPFLLLSTSAASEDVMRGYSLNVQGYFIKPDSIEGIKDLFERVVKYWALSQRPVTQR